MEIKTAHSYFVSGGFLDKLNTDWRMLGNLDAVISRSQQSDILDGEYAGSKLWA